MQVMAVWEELDVPKHLCHFKDFHKVILGELQEKNFKDTVSS